LSRAAHIEEVGGFTSVKFDDVHGAHGKTSSVNKTADVTSDMDVIQVPFGCNKLLLVLRALIFLVKKILLAESGIAVNGDFTIGCKYFVIVSKHKGIDLNHVTIARNEAIVDGIEH